VALAVAVSVLVVRSLVCLRARVTKTAANTSLTSIGRYWLSLGQFCIKSRQQGVCLYLLFMGVLLLCFVSWRMVFLMLWEAIFCRIFGPTKVMQCSLTLGGSVVLCGNSLHAQGTWSPTCACGVRFHRLSLSLLSSLGVCVAHQLHLSLY